MGNRRSGVLIPREHGAYGQVLFPLAAVLGLRWPSGAAMLLALAVLAGFLAHEGLVVRLGLRGPRARRELGGEATRSLAVFGVGALIAGGVALGSGGRAVASAMGLPLVLSGLALASTWRGAERSARGETLAATALASWALPVAAASGVDRLTALACWLTWTATFVVATLAVRSVIARTAHRPAWPSATAALACGGASAVVAAGLSVVGHAPQGLWVAQLPALALAVALVAIPVSARRLHRVGWVIIAVCVLTLASLVVAFREGGGVS